LAQGFEHSFLSAPCHCRSQRVSVHYFASSSMVRLRRLSFLLLFLPTGARRSLQLDDSQHGAQGLNSVLAKELHVSSESRDALIPGGFRMGRARRAGRPGEALRQQAGALRGGSRPDGRLAGRLEAHRAAPWAILEGHVDPSSPLATLAIAAIEANNLRNQRRDVSMMASEGEAVSKPEWPTEAASEPKLLTEEDRARESFYKVLVQERVDGDTIERLLKVTDEVDAKARQSLAAGITSPVGFFDPLGLATADTMTGGKLLFYREVELKHGRIAMLASLGILVGEQFHPLFGGNIDVPSYIAFQQTPLQTFWPAVLVAVAIPELFSIFSFQTPANIVGLQSTPGREVWAIRTNHVPGDFGFDPLGLKPKDPVELLWMQNKELNHGRLAMIAAAGMIAQELATGQKLF